MNFKTIHSRKPDGTPDRELVTKYSKNNFKIHPAFVNRYELIDLRSAIDILLSSQDDLDGAFTYEDPPAR